MSIWGILNNISESFSSLFSSKQRSFLGLIGIIIGTASVIMLANISAIVKNKMMEQFKSMGTNVFVVNLDVYEENAEGFTIQQINMLQKSEKKIKFLVPFESVNAEVDYKDKKNNDYYSIIACSPELLKILKIDVKSGRKLSNFDTYEPYIFIGSDMQKNSHQILGSIIRLNQTGFSVVGVNKSVEDNMLLPFSPNTSAFISLKNAESLSKSFKISTLIGVAINDSVIQDITFKLRYELKKLFPKQHSSIRTAKMIISEAQKQADLLAILLIAIGSIALIVGGIGVMNVMLVSVVQRKSEVGLRVALGATSFDIKTLFLSEAILLCSLGGIIGTCLGISVSYVFAIYMNMSFVVNWLSVPAGIFIALLSGICSGVYPASQAAKMNPIEALRNQ